MTEQNTTTTSYVELAKETYQTLVDAISNSNQQALDYTKAVWEVLARPYPSSALETAVRENFDRSKQIVSLTIGDMQTRAQRSAELAEKLAAQSAKFQETSVQAIRGVANTGLSNVNYVKETATQQFDDFSKRLDEAQQRAASTMQAATTSKN